MLTNKYHSQIKTYGHILFLPVLLFAFMSNAKTDLPVFLLSGQSNMTGYGGRSGLTTDQQKNVDSVKIYFNTRWEGNASKLRQWLTLGTGFGSTIDSIGPELYFGRTLSDSMPAKRVALIKFSSGSTYLGKSSDWLPPSSNTGTGGTLYTWMKTAIDTLYKKINVVYDTSKYSPRWAGFIWLQGEFDAYDTAYANAYEKNLTNLIKDIRSALNDTLLPVIIPMISTYSGWKYNSTVRAAEVAVTKKFKNVDTLDTKAFTTDANGHYTGQSQVKIGTIAAQRWLAMNYNGQTVPIAYQYSPSLVAQTQKPQVSHMSGFLYDVSGRRMVKMNGQTENMPFGIFITNRNQADAQYKVILNGIKTR
jgi:hypothetical protein